VSRDLIIGIPFGIVAACSFFLWFLCFVGVGIAESYQQPPEPEMWAGQYVFAVVPLAWVAWFVAFVRRRHQLSARRNLGCCLGCGYDLRASNEKCPEWGKPIALDASA
jgi:hypothetical protein